MSYVFILFSVSIVETFKKVHNGTQGLATVSKVRKTYRIILFYKPEQKKVQNGMPVDTGKVLERPNLRTELGKYRVCEDFG